MAARGGSTRSHKDTKPLRIIYYRIRIGAGGLVALEDGFTIGWPCAMKAFGSLWLCGFVLAGTVGWHDRCRNGSRLRAEVDAWRFTGTSMGGIIPAGDGTGGGSAADFE